MSSPFRLAVALLVTAALGAAAAVGAVALLGGFDDGTTTVVQETTAVSPTQGTPNSVVAMSVNEIYERAATGVVRINSQSSSSVVDQEALGSGFVVDKNGHIVTNYHVIAGGDEIRVGFSNRVTVEARLVGSDPTTDLAVLRVNIDADGLTPLPLGDSDLVKVGDPVVAIGNPFGLDRTATAGIVSAVQRLITAPSDFKLDHIIQTDAPINKGNSGGPLLNNRGEVIGVNTQIETGGLTIGNVGIGFAVPAKTVKNVVAQILRTGRVEHAHLGISGNPITPQVAASYKLPAKEGVLVEGVTEGSGADKAGLMAGDTQVVVLGEPYLLGGDIIVAADGKKTSSIEELRDAIAAHMPGEKLELQLYRDGEKTSVTVTLGRRSASP